MSEEKIDLDIIRYDSSNLMFEAARAEEEGDIVKLKEVIDQQDHLLRILGSYAYNLEERLLVDSLTKISSFVDFETNILPEIDKFYNKDESYQERSFPSDYILYFVDIDGLGEINRLRGHRGGDEALISCAEALRSITRNVDWVGRKSSRADEFLLLIRLTENQASMDTSVMCDSLTERIHRSLNEIDSTISISVGTARASECDDTEDLIHTADTRMFENKVHNYANKGINYLEHRSR